MGDIKGFLKVKRAGGKCRPVSERLKDYREVTILRPDRVSQDQSSRCMDCGVPFCHFGCPVYNVIPEWNDLVFHGRWKEALQVLHSTNNLPEITGRVCPAPCETACVLGLNDDPVTCRENELAIIEYGFKKRWIKPNPPKKRTGRKIAVIGSGPAGLAAADELNKAGHRITVFEKDDRVGGILRYGIPDFKLDKAIVDRRINIFKKEGIVFKTRVNVGVDYPVDKLIRDFDAICLTCGSRVPRDLNIAGRELGGIHFAMDYLTQSNRRVAGEKIPQDKLIDACNKNVVVIGGGDTGSDCVGTAHRQGARSVVQIEVMPRPPECRTEDYPWPRHPLLLKTSTSHQEGGERHWSVLTKKFIGEKGRLKKLSCVRVEFPEVDAQGCPLMREVANSSFEIKADLVILAVGFVYPEHVGLVKKLKLELDKRGNVKAGDDYMTSRRKVFSAGDMRRGQSLVVWAIYEGREAARSVDKYLMG